MITVDKISKCYQIGGGIAPTFLDTFEKWFKRTPCEKRDFWALRDVSFDVQQGEILAVIGKNGAGKSTLLKIMAKVTEPTSGRAMLRGRVGSLLEVGTGFHPDLSGRENIYLNGAILGMKKWEINRKFHDIVAFSEIEKFIDTPVKHYSSGMYVRLAFAVAAHLEPEILLVDEVLAVGDADFQKKCMGKIGEVSKQGRTVLLVSHNMAAVLGLSTRAIVLNEGRLIYSGGPGESVKQYQNALMKKIERPAGKKEVFETKGPRLLEVRFLSRDGRSQNEFSTGEPMTMELTVENPLEGTPFSVGAAIFSNEGLYCYGCNSFFDKAALKSSAGRSVIRLNFNELNLLDGIYSVSLAIANETGSFNYDYRPREFYFTVKSSLHDHGVIYLKHQWEQKGQV